MGVSSSSSSFTKTHSEEKTLMQSIGFTKTHGNVETPRATSPRGDRVKTPLQNHCDRHYSQASELQRGQVGKGGGGEEAGEPNSAAEDVVLKQFTLLHMC